MPRKTADKTLAMRLLEGRKIAYESFAYDPDVFVSANEVAEAIGMPPKQVYKTLVTQPDRGKLILAVLPASAELDLKMLAKVVDVKKVKMASQADAENWTGLQKGGIRALALVNKSFRVFLDASAQNFDRIAMSAGERGVQVALAPEDFVAVTRARVAEIGKK